MSTQAHEFDVPDIAPTPGLSPGRWISVAPNDNYVGIGAGFAREEWQAEHYDRLILAFDEKNRPWVGCLPANGRKDVGATIYMEDGRSPRVESDPLHAKLRQFVWGGDRTRLYWTGETETLSLDGEAVQLYRVAPEGRSDE